MLPLQAYKRDPKSGGKTRPHLQDTDANGASINPHDDLMIQRTASTITMMCEWVSPIPSTSASAHQFGRADWPPIDCPPRLSELYLPRIMGNTGPMVTLESRVQGVVRCEVQPASEGGKGSKSPAGRTAGIFDLTLTLYQRDMTHKGCGFAPSFVPGKGQDRYGCAVCTPVSLPTSEIPEVVLLNL